MTTQNNLELFDQAITYTFGNEGGFVNDPADSGGPTCMGITLATLSSWLKRPASVAEVHALTRETACAFYHAQVWVPMGCDLIEGAPFAITLFDTAVLYGNRVAALFAQQTLRKYSDPLLTVDGFIGPETAALFSEINPRIFVQSMHALLLGRIESLIESNPLNEKFRNGWVNRADRLLTLA